ncbi:MAG: PDZ domain-containing protein [Acidobacteriota bacterium]
MRKILFVLYIILILFIRLNSTEKIVKFESEIKGVLKEISPSLVKVVTENHRNYIASGIAVESDLIVSNIKLIGHPYTKIYVVTVKGNKYGVKVVGKDKFSSLILLKSDKNVFRPVKMGKKGEIGDWIGLVGAFYKEFPFLNQGIISSQTETELILNGTVVPGSSGGAVVNKKGEFLGVIRGVFGFRSFPQYTFKDNSAELKIMPLIKRQKDLCYAVPAGRVLRVVKDLKKYGYVKRGWLGVNISDNKKGFVKVDHVTVSSPADSGGIKKGDYILNVAGKSIKHSQGLADSIKEMNPGDKVIVKVRRNGNRKDIKVVLGEYKIDTMKLKKIQELEFQKKLSVIPERLERIPSIRNYTFNLSRSKTLGVDVISLTPELADEFGVKEKTGLLVSKTSSVPAAGKIKLKVGDILVKAKGKVLKKPSDLKDALNSLKEKESLNIKFYRKGKLLSAKIVPQVGRSNFFFLNKFSDKFFDVRRWVEENEVRRLKESLEKLEKYKSQKEKKRAEYANKRIRREIELLKKEQLRKYKREMGKLLKEKKKLEEEIKKMKEEKEKKKKSG